MADNLTDRGQRDKARLDLRQDNHNPDSAKSVGVAEGQLKEALHAAGESPNRVRDYTQVKAFIDKLRDYVKRRKSAQRQGSRVDG